MRPGWLLAWQLAYIGGPVMMLVVVGSGASALMVCGRVSLLPRLLFFLPAGTGILLAVTIIYQVGGAQGLR